MITIDDRPIRSVLGRLAGELQRPRALNAKVARHMRDYVRQTITIQGRPIPWKPLSPLYKRSSGKFKAMLGIRNQIQAAWDDNGAYVYYQPKGGERYSLRQLELGWFQKAFEMPVSSYNGKVVRRRMRIPGARGAKPIYLFKRKSFTVPGRKVWPGYVEAQREIRAIAYEHVGDFVKRLK